MGSRDSIVWLGLWLMLAGCAGTSGPRQATGLPGDLVEPTWVVEALPAGGDGIRVSWGSDACSGGGCRVERAESANGPWAEIARPEPGATRLEDGGLSSRVRYHYRVVRGQAGTRIVSPPASGYVVSDELPLADWINVADHAICTGGDCDWSATLQKIIDEQLFYWRWGTAGRATISPSTPGGTTRSFPSWTSTERWGHVTPIVPRFLMLPYGDVATPSSVDP